MADRQSVTLGMIKVREFARHGFEEGSGNNNEDKDIGDDSFDVHVDQGSNFRLMSRSPLQDNNVTLVEDIKPIYGNVQVKCPFLIDEYKIDKWQLQDIENIEGRKDDLNEKRVRKGVLKERSGSEDVLKERISIPNPAKKRLKAPVRLHKQISESRNPVVGLNYIKEYIAVSDSEMEPYYKCGLCEKQGNANSMFSHVMGQQHKKGFLTKIKYDPEFLEHMNSHELFKHVEIYAENNCNLYEKIHTIVSDKLYPWPPGKAPWPLEKVGNGSNVNIVVQSKEDTTEGEGRGEMQCAQFMESPKNSEEAVKMLELSEQMWKIAIESRWARLSVVEKETIGAIFTSVISRIKVKRNIPTGIREDTSENNQLRNLQSLSPQVVKREMMFFSNSSSDKERMRMSSMSPSRKTLKKMSSKPPSKERQRRMSSTSPSRKRQKRMSSLSPYRERGRKMLSTSPSRKRQMRMSSSSPSRERRRKMSSTSSSKKRRMRMSSSSPSRKRSTFPSRKRRMRMASLSPSRERQRKISSRSPRRSDRSNSSYNSKYQVKEETEKGDLGRKSHYVERREEK